MPYAPNHSALPCSRVLTFARTLASVLALCMVVAADAQTQHTIISFDPPGASSSAGNAINDHGQIAGNWTPLSNLSQVNAFIRQPNGTFVTFSVNNSIFTAANTINNKGEVAGCVGCGTTTQATFIRDAHGTIRLFHVPGASLQSPAELNDAGWVVGLLLRQGRRPPARLYPQPEVWRHHHRGTSRLGRHNAYHHQ